MATAKPLHSPPRRRLRRLLVVGAILVVLTFAAFWSTIRSRAVAGASVGARIACSCRFVGGRTLSDCRKDFEPGMGLVVLSEDESNQTVTARVPLLSKQTATFRTGEGCMLEKWPI